MSRQTCENCKKLFYSKRELRICPTCKKEEIKNGYAILANAIMGKSQGTK